MTKKTAITTILRGVRHIAAGAVLAFGVWGANAATFEEGSEAYRKGDYAAALAIWEPLADAGDPNAQYAAGYLHQNGLGTEENTTRAALLYDDAARQGDRDAQYALGMLLQFGDGVPQDFPRAMAWFKKATEGEPPNADAEFAVARLYFRGLGGPRDFTKALEWLQRAAEHKNPAAYYLLASCYDTGIGIAEDKVKAYYYYTLAWRAGTKVVQAYDSSYMPEDALVQLKAGMTKSQIAEAEKLLKTGITRPSSKGARSK